MFEALRALVEPRRVEILCLLREGEMTAGAISHHFDVTRPAVSQHLQVLKHAGLVSVRREGTRRLYSARPEGLAEVREFVDDFWAGRLEQLRVAVEEAEGESRRRAAGQRRGAEVGSGAKSDS